MSDTIYATGSRNHSYLQARLAITLGNLEKYTVFTELSLDIETEYGIKEPRPDVCLYPKQCIDPVNDVLKMSEMPLLAVEILSPMQNIQTIIDKFRLYFKAGVKSCWLVIPTIRAVTVFSSLENSRTFIMGELSDDVLGIRVAVEDIFL